MKASFRQLEAFYHVALHQGISRAARACRLDKSTLSAHILELEAALRTRLFQRAPFKLTRHGRLLFDALRQAWHLVESSTDEIHADTAPMMRFAAAEIVNQDFFPDIIATIGRLYPRVHCSNETGSEQELRDKLRDCIVDCVVAPEHPGWEGMSCRRLIKLPVTLICPDKWAVKIASELWARPKIDDLLFIPGASPTLVQCFDTGLNGLHAKWPERRQISTGFAVTKMVAHGLGFGLTVDIPNLVKYAGIHTIPLPHFPMVSIAVFWRGSATRVHRTAIALTQRAARELECSRSAGHRKIGET